MFARTPAAKHSSPGRARLLRAATAFVTLVLLACACSSGGDDADAGLTPAAPTPTIDVFRATPVDRTIRMSEWKIEGVPERVTGGVNNFIAMNDGTVAHNLSVLKVLEGDQRDFNAQTQNLEPGQSETVSVLLDAGTYQLVCLIVPGVAGSTENHEQNGMKTTFVVE